VAHVRNGAGHVIIGALVAFGILLMAASTRGSMTSSTKKPEPWEPVKPSKKQAMRDLIREVAAAQGVPPYIALAFADLESGFDPNAKGDTHWHLKDGGALYRKSVLENVRFARNPARNDPTAWHSYGLFQLLAPFHAGGSEHPKVLFDPRVNATRGVAFIGKLLKRYGGDVHKARLAYVGCGADGSRCDAEYVARVRERLDKALAKWSRADG
jgi:hypothetical protein